MEQNSNTEIAIFAAGCFWGVELEFSRMDGVLSAESGYIGGRKERPTYHEVCEGGTGHAEAVRITFDPSQISYGRLVEEFFNLHDPTTLNRQGPDVGEQYRSAIFYTNPAQMAIAQAAKAQLAESKEFDNPIVTQILPADTFWRAEEYHQKYFEKRGMDSCHIRRK
jgi:peptide-methionine (S)-S-oxide reductase